MNWRLLFSGLKSPGWATYAIVGILLALTLSYWLLRLERRLVSPRVGWILITLRTLVLLTLLVTMLQPVLTKQFDLTKRGRVIVAIDGSLSMETQDRHASLAEKLRWAQSLGMLGNIETSELIDRWVVAAENGEEPNWLGTDVPPKKAAEQAGFDLRKQQIMSSVEELASMPRVEFVRRLLESQPQKLLAQLGEVMPIDLRLFAKEQQSAIPAELAALLHSERLDLVPSSTDVVQLLQSVTAEENADQLRGVVLITDGRQTAPGDWPGTAQRMASLGVPVYSIPIGSRFPPRDLSIAAIESPETVFLNDKAQVKAVVGTSGFEGQPLTVRLEKEGVTVDEQTVTPASDTATVVFSVPTDMPGRFGYQLVTDVQAGELREDNNVRDVSLQVVDSKARVMLLEGDARWEFRYLKNLVDRDKQVEPQSVLFRQPYLNLLNQPYITSALPPLDAFAEQLASTDLLIVGDVAPAQVDEGVWDRIEKAVTRDGLTLIIVPGRRDMPHSFQSAALKALLPVTDFRQRLAEQFLPSVPDAAPSVFHLNLSPDGHALPMFQLSADPAAKNSVLSELPGHPWIYGGVPKPGAVVLAYASLPEANVAPEPTIIHQDYGFGQVLWMGLDSTWRWRMRAGDEWHYKFWGQVIRWAARNKSASGNDDVRMTLSDVIVDQTESVEAIVRWDAGLLAQLQDAVVEAVAVPVDSVHASDPDEDQKTEPQIQSSESPVTAPSQLSAVLRPSVETPERFTGRLPRLPAGVWKIELRITGGTLTLKEPVQCEVLVREQLSAELADVSCNRELLTELSDLSGGALVEPFDAGRLVELIQPKDQVLQKIEERTLWDHWLILAIFFSLLMSEWVIRKINGLP